VTLTIVIAAAAVAMVVLVALIARRHRTPDTVDAFRRQIDALSPEARRPVVDRVQELDTRPGSRNDDAPGGG